MKRPWCWQRFKVGGEGDDRGWDCFMASLIQWAWVWINSASWWRAGTPGMFLSMGSQRVVHDWMTELNRTELSSSVPLSSCTKFFPASGSFPVIWLLASDGQTIGSSSSALVPPWRVPVDFFHDWVVWYLCCPQDCQEYSQAWQLQSLSDLALSSCVVHLSAP